MLRIDGLRRIRDTFSLHLHLHRVRFILPRQYNLTQLVALRTSINPLNPRLSLQRKAMANVAQLFTLNMAPPTQIDRTGLPGFDLVARTLSSDKRWDTRFLVVFDRGRWRIRVILAPAMGVSHWGWRSRYCMT